MTIHHGFTADLDRVVPILPWRFDRDFATPSPGSKVTGCMAEGQVSPLQAELDALRATQAKALAAARAEGYAEGLAAATAGQQSALLSAIDALQAAMEDASAWRAEREESLSGDAAQLALAAADFLAGTAIGLAPASAIKEALTNVMQQVPRSEEVRLTVHPELVAPMEAHLGLLQSQDRRKLAVHILADAGLAKGDARFDWHGGGMELDAGLRRAAIAAELQALLHHSPPGEDKPFL